MGIRIEYNTSDLSRLELRVLADMLTALAAPIELPVTDRERAVAAEMVRDHEEHADAGTTDAPPPVTVGFDPSAHQAAISGQFKDLMETSVANVLNYAAETSPPVAVGFGLPPIKGEGAVLLHDAGCTRDSKNLPWDERIHSGNRALNADGTWRRRRGVDEALVERVEAELLGVAVEEPQPTVVVPPPPPVTVPAPPTITFASLIQRVTAAVSAGTLTRTVVSEICQKLGVEALPLVGGRPDLFPALSAELTALGV